MRGRLPAAMVEYEKSTELDDDPLPLGLLAAAKAKAGDRATALGILNRLQKIAKQRYVADCSFALINLALGQKGEAMKYLEASYAQHQPDVKFEALAEKIVPMREFKSQHSN
jgi:tetratricopeptide (TPR) repeat protein